MFSLFQPSQEYILKFRLRVSGFNQSLMDDPNVNPFFTVELVKVPAVPTTTSAPTTTTTTAEGGNSKGKKGKGKGKSRVSEIASKSKNVTAKLFDIRDYGNAFEDPSFYTIQ